MLQLFLFLHVLGAIAIFGPTFTFPIMGRLAARMPQHRPFAAELSHTIESRIVLPGLVVQALTGIALILIVGADLTAPAWRWLVAAIVLYLIASGFAALVQAPAVAKLAAFASHAPAPGGGAPGGGAPGGGAPGGPPPEVVAASRTVQRGGIVLTVLLVLIVALMVTKPGV